MAINTQKFLPSAKSSSSIVKSSSTEVSKFLAPNSSLTVYKDVDEIKVKAIEVNKLLKNTLLLTNKESKDSKKDKENEKRKEKESLLEKKKDYKTPEKSLPTMPKVGLLESVKRFLFFTFLGTAFTKFNKYLPEIILFTKKIEPVAKFLEDFSGNVLNGIMSFIDWGYKASDATRGFLKDVGGDSTVKLFDKFSNSLNDFVNAAIIFGMLASKGSSPKGGFGGKGGKVGFDVSGRKVSKKTQQRYLKRFGEKPFVQRFGTKNLKQVAKQQFGKRAARLVGKSFGRIPIIGGLIDFSINLALGEDPGRAAAKAVGATTGAALGSLIPVPLAGTILGGILGDIVGGALYDTFAGPKSPKKGRAQGGSVTTRSGQAVGGKVGRSIKKYRTTPQKISPQPSVPGKDVGGINELVKLYGDDKDPKTKSPLRVLKQTSSSLKKIPLFGNLMGASIDLALGQKPDKRIFKSVANSFGSFIQGVIDNNITSTLGDISRTIAGLAEGGIVPRMLEQDSNVGYNIGTLISKVFGVMLDSRVNEIFQSLRNEMGLPGGYGPPGSMGGELARGSLPRGNITIEQLIGLAKGAGFSDSDAVIMAAIAMAESGGNSNAHNNKPPDNSYGLWQINMIGDLGPERRRQFGIGNDEELKDPVVNAHAAKLIKQSQGFGAWTVYKTGSYKRYLSIAQRSAGSPAITVYKAPTAGGFLPLGGEQGSLQEARRIAESFGVPLYSHTRPGDPGYHGLGRAMDFSNDSVGGGTPEQLKLAQTLVKRFGSTAKEILYTPLGFSIKDGKKVGLIDPYNHYHHVHVAFKRGGRVYRPTFATLAEDGRQEFVFDGDTTAGLDRLAPGILEKLNVAKTKPQLASILQDYADYEQPEVIVMIQPVEKEVVKPIPMGGGGSLLSSGGVNTLIPQGLMQS
jgi:hypothetical protein